MSEAGSEYSEAASRFSSKLGCYLNDFRKENQFCDVIISVSGRDFNAHKLVLAASSSYFRAMFTSGFREASENKVSIDGTPEIFETILEFIYTGKMKINRETVHELLEMACYMQLTDASEYIAYRLIEHEYGMLCGDDEHTIPLGYVCKICDIASCHSHLKHLLSESENHLCYYINDLMSAETFPQHASIDFLKKFLTNPDLRGIEEKDVLELVVKWLKHDFENRREFAPSLLRRCRLGLVPEESCTELLGAEILDIPECKEILDSVRNHEQSGISPSTLAVKYPSLFSTRSTITAAVAAVASGFESASFQYFEEKKKKWEKIPKMAKLSWVPSLIVVDGKLYAVGGMKKCSNKARFPIRDFQLGGRVGWQPPSDERDDADVDVVLADSFIDFRNDFQIYDSQRNRWHKFPAMKRSGVPKLVHLDNCIYAIGHDQDMSQEVVECYDMAETWWKDVTFLPNGVTSTFAVAFQGSILLYGQFTDKVTNEEREEILMYKPSEDEWLHSECNEASGAASTSKPLLFIHGERCYRVKFCKDSNSGDEEKAQEKVIVNQVKINQKSQSIISFGEDISQDSVPPNELGGFRIGEEAFIIVNGAVHKIGVMKKEQDKDDVTFTSWMDFELDPHDQVTCSNTVTFAIDTKF